MAVEVVHRAREVEHEAEHLRLRLRRAVLRRRLGAPFVHLALARHPVDQPRLVQFAVGLPPLPRPLLGLRLAARQQHAQLLHLLRHRAEQPLVRLGLVLGHVNLGQPLLPRLLRHLARGGERLGRDVRLLRVGDLVDRVAVRQPVRPALAAQPGGVAAAVPPAQVFPPTCGAPVSSTFPCFGASAGFGLESRTMESSSALIASPPPPPPPSRQPTIDAIRRAPTAPPPPPASTAPPRRRGAP